MNKGTVTALLKLKTLNDNSLINQIKLNYENRVSSARD